MIFSNVCRIPLLVYATITSNSTYLESFNLLYWLLLHYCSHNTWQKHFKLGFLLAYGFRGFQAVVRKARQQEHVAEAVHIIAS